MARVNKDLTFKQGHKINTHKLNSKPLKTIPLTETHFSLQLPTITLLLSEPSQPNLPEIPNRQCRNTPSLP
jgi:hypothetical protein